MTATKTKWTHKVVKQSRGGQGEWFSHKATFTGDMSACENVAELFLADQIAPTEMGNSLKGSMGHRITIKTRGGRIEKIYRY